MADAKHIHDHADHKGHAHAGHSHGPVNDEGRVAWAFAIILVFMFVEAAGGLISNSLALLADAGHMVSDAAALGMSWLALRVGKRASDVKRSYGYKRIEVLAAFVNGCTLFLIAGWIAFEAAHRFMAPSPVLGGTMFWVALAGLVANLVAFFILNGGNRENLNIRSAWLHILGDVFGFVVAIVAALIIMSTGWAPIDPLLSVLVALLILRSAWQVVRASAHILLEGAPPGVDLLALKTDLISAAPGIVDIHHVHAWSLTGEEPLVTLHARCAPGADHATIVPALTKRLREQFGIGHSTIQLEGEDCFDETHS